MSPRRLFFSERRIRPFCVSQSAMQHQPLRLIWNRAMIFVGDYLQFFISVRLNSRSVLSVRSPAFGRLLGLSDVKLVIQAVCYIINRYLYLWKIFLMIAQILNFSKRTAGGAETLSRKEQKNSRLFRADAFQHLGRHHKRSTCPVCCGGDYQRAKDLCKVIEPVNTDNPMRRRFCENFFLSLIISPRPACVHYIAAIVWRGDTFKIKIKFSS